ncbi:SLBB domain-containing protein [candidate division KSB1 bacterium]|nr:SLBB domain-containing protein [candidate division KSB1 bacterium]
MLRSNPNKFILINLAFIFMVTSAYTQISGSAVSRGAQYYLGSEDELLVPINIWGFVQKPGQYLVPNNTDLISLLSFAGGPTEDAKISNIRIVRSDPKLGSQIWKIDVDRYIETGDERLIPTLKPHDTVIVKGTTFYWVSRMFEFVSRLAVFAQMYYFIILADSYKNR